MKFQLSPEHVLVLEAITSQQEEYVNQDVLETMTGMVRNVYASLDLYYTIKHVFNAQPIQSQINTGQVVFVKSLDRYLNQVHSNV